MTPLLRALALLAALPALDCSFFEPPEPFTVSPPEIPPPEFRPLETDEVPMLEVYEHSGLWLAKWPIGSFYLFGSNELAPDGGYSSFGPAVEAAYAESQEVVHEIDLGAGDPAKTIALLRRYGMLKSPATLRSRVPSDTWALLEEKFAKSGRSAAGVRSMKPWLVSFALANGATFARGDDPLPAIADRVQERAQLVKANAEKPIVGLQTLESHFQMLAALPPGVQNSLLRSVLGGEWDDKFLRSSPAMIDLLASHSKERALLYEHLVYRRNEQIAERLLQIGIDGKLRFVVVGILHLAGERGIPSLLAQRGFKVSRVQ